MIFINTHRSNRQSGPSTTSKKTIPTSGLVWLTAEETTSFQKTRFVNSGAVSQITTSDIWSQRKNLLFINSKVPFEIFRYISSKAQDWPTTDDICRKMPLHFKAFKEFLPSHEICRRDGALNLGKYLPKYFCIPDLGPKMYIAYGWLEEFIDKSKQEVFLKMKQVTKKTKKWWFNQMI